MHKFSLKMRLAMFVDVCLECHGVVVEKGVGLREKERQPLFRIIRAFAQTTTTTTLDK